jgi:hypothetical protein
MIIRVASNACTQFFCLSGFRDNELDFTNQSFIWIRRSVILGVIETLSVEIQYLTSNSEYGSMMRTLVEHKNLLRSATHTLKLRTRLQAKVVVRKA